MAVLACLTFPESEIRKMVYFSWITSQWKCLLIIMIELSRLVVFVTDVAKYYWIILLNITENEITVSSIYKRTFCISYFFIRKFQIPKHLKYWFVPLVWQNFWSYCKLFNVMPKAVPVTELKNLILCCSRSVGWVSKRTGRFTDISQTHKVWAQ